LKSNDIKKSFALAGIPSFLHTSDESLSRWDKDSSVFNHCVEALDWIEEGGLAGLSTKSSVVELVYTSDSDMMKVFYLIARAAVLKGVSVKCVHALELMPPNLNDDMWEELQGKGLLVVDGINYCESGSHSDSQLKTLEWVMSKWLMQGKSLLIHTEKRLIGDDVFSQSFRSLIENRVVKKFIQV
tara:strand:+ start:5048 stop:5602 length:555 start_codon:yes stop_codon:yes gene_type:complete